MVRVRVRWIWIDVENCIELDGTEERVASGVCMDDHHDFFPSVAFIPYSLPIPKSEISCLANSRDGTENRTRFSFPI
jgi:hypothetical protein